MTYTQYRTPQQKTQSFFNEQLLTEALLMFPGCYLIHADRKLHHAQHYIGYSSNIASRVALHRKSQGSKLVKAFNENGITWRVARIWKGENRTFERALHDKKNSVKLLCPICKQEAIAQRLNLQAQFHEPLATLDMLLTDVTSLARVVAQ